MMQKLLLCLLCAFSLSTAQQQYPVDDLCDLPNTNCRASVRQSGADYRYWVAAGVVTAVTVWFFADGSMKKSFERWKKWCTECIKVGKRS